MNHNNSIGCTVTECSYHCKEDNYCTLEQIEVSKDTAGKATSPSGTECASFEVD